MPIITAFRRAGKSIQHRRTVQVNTQCPQLTAHHTPNFVGVGGIARAGNDHGAGKNRGFAAQAGNTAALLVDGDKSRQTVFRHDGVLDLSVQLRQRGPPGTVFAKQNNVADMIFT